MSSINGGGCSNCGGRFLDGEDYRDHLPCENAVQKAVREEREAVVRYLNHVSSDDSWIDAQTAVPWIERGDHRK